MDDYEDSFEKTSDSSSDSTVVDSGNSETVSSPIPKSLDSLTSRITPASSDEAIRSINNAPIEGKVSDTVVVQEEAAHSFVIDGSTPSLATSLSDAASIEQGMPVSNIAQNQTVYNLLSEFQAFRSFSRSSEEREKMPDALPSPSDPSDQMANLTTAKQVSKSQKCSTRSLSTNASQARRAQKDSVVREGSSSLFSTLSQHLKTSKQTKLAVVDAASNARPVPYESSIVSQEVKSKIEYDAPKTSSNVESEMSAAPVAGPLLPDLPPSSLSLNNPSKVSNSPSGMRPPLSSRVNMLRINNTASEVVPPLPPPAVVQLSPQTQPPALDPKLVELRETSEAVERLVKAFALLRNQSKQAHRPDHVDSLPGTFQNSIKETLSSTAFHKIQGNSTVRTVSTKHPAQSPHPRSSRAPPCLHLEHPPTPSPLLSADDIVALKSNEAKIEETLMACVLEMLKRDLTQPRRAQALVNVLKARPSHETITADEFKENTVAFGNSISAIAGAGGQRRPWHPHTYSVFDGDMRAFDPGDDDASAMLFHSIQNGIHKYVFHHVVNPMRKLARTSRSVTFPITPHFSWILLLDVLTVCENIAALGFKECGTPTGLLLVRYEGDSSCEFIARNAIQCLPFEPLETGARKLRKDKPVFRLEYWVTKDKMQILIAAITDCIRQHIVQEARTRPYMALLEGDAEIHPTVLVPSKVPLFSFIKPDLLGNVTLTGEADHTKLYERGGSSYKDCIPKQDLTRSRERHQGDENMLGMNPKSLETMAYAISVLTTDILESFTTPELRKGPSPFPSLRNPTDYDDLSKIVAETMCELIEDTAIKASIERRARDKFIKLQKEKKEFPSKDRLEKERLIIQRAEKEVNDMLNRIVQQMSLKASHT